MSNLQDTRPKKPREFFVYQDKMTGSLHFSMDKKESEHLIFLMQTREVLPDTALPEFDEAAFGNWFVMTANYGEGFSMATTCARWGWNEALKAMRGER